MNKLGPHATNRQLGNFMASSTDPFGCLVVNRAVHKIVYDRLNTSPFRMFDIYCE